MNSSSYEHMIADSVFVCMCVGIQTMVDHTQLVGTTKPVAEVACHWLFAASLFLA